MRRLKERCNPSQDGDTTSKCTVRFVHSSNGAARLSLVEIQWSATDSGWDTCSLPPDLIRIDLLLSSILTANELVLTIEHQRSISAVKVETVRASSWWDITTVRHREHNGLRLVGENIHLLATSGGAMPGDKFHATSTC